MHTRKPRPGRSCSFVQIAQMLVVVTRMRPPPAVASFVNGPFVLLWVSLGLQGSATGIFLQLNCCAVLGGVQT